MLSSLGRYFFCPFVEKCCRNFLAKNVVDCRIPMSIAVDCRRNGGSDVEKCWRKMLAKNVVGFLCRKTVSIAVEYKKMMSKFVNCCRKMLAKFTVELYCRIIPSKFIVEKYWRIFVSKNDGELYRRKIL